MSDIRKERPHKPIAASVGTMPAAVPDTAPDGPMTDRQAVILRELAEKHGEPFDGNLTESQAQERIEDLESRD